MNESGFKKKTCKLFRDVGPMLSRFGASFCDKTTIYVTDKTIKLVFKDSDFFYGN